MRYEIHKGVNKVKSRIQKLIIGLTALAFPVALALSSGAASAAPPPFALQPFTFVGAAGDCGTGYPAGTPGGVVARWDNSTGNPAPSILLQKNVPTADCSAAGVDIITPLEGGPVSNLTELNYDYKIGGHCGAGAPRFNIQTENGTAITLGCVYGTQTPSTTTGWMHVEFNQAQIAAAVATVGGTTLQDVYIIFDEGSDTPSGGTIGTPGSINIDNISVNGQNVGSPTGPTDKDACKKGGWQNLLDANGKTFKNQGDCVSYVATGGKNVANGM